MTKIKKHKDQAEEPESETTEKKSARKGRKDTKPSGGWGVYETKRRVNSATEREFKPLVDIEYLIKFADEAPYATYNQHWIDEVEKGVKKSYICYQDEDGDSDECPLCQIGDNPTTYSLFNVVLIAQSDKSKTKPAMKIWRASTTVAEKLKRLANAKRSQPLNRNNLYFAVEMTKPNQNRTDWDISPIKADDLAEDGWDGVTPFSDKEIETWTNDRFSEISDIVKVDTLEALKELADSLDN